MKVQIIDPASGQRQSELELPEASFDARFNEALVHQIVTAYQATARQGTRAQKNRAAVRGGGRKPWAQKGSGRARAGSIRSPLWRGGGKIFPAQPTENFTQKVNRKMYRAALRAIFSELLRQQRLIAVESFGVDAPKTKGLVEKLKKMGASDALILTDVADDNLSLSARNLHKVAVCPVNQMDPVSLIAHEKVIATKGALKRVEELLA